MTPHERDLNAASQATASRRPSFSSVRTHGTHTGNSNMLSSPPRRRGFSSGVTSMLRMTTEFGDIESIVFDPSSVMEGEHRPPRRTSNRPGTARMSTSINSRYNGRGSVVPAGRSLRDMYFQGSTSEVLLSSGAGPSTRASQRLAYGVPRRGTASLSNLGRSHHSLSQTSIVSEASFQPVVQRPAPPVPSEGSSRGQQGDLYQLPSMASSDHSPTQSRPYSRERRTRTPSEASLRTPQRPQRALGSRPPSLDTEQRATTPFGSRKTLQHPVTGESGRHIVQAQRRCSVSSSSVARPEDFEVYSLNAPSPTSPRRGSLRRHAFNVRASQNSMRNAYRTSRAEESSVDCVDGNQHYVPNGVRVDPGAASVVGSVLDEKEMDNLPVPMSNLTEAVTTTSLPLISAPLTNLAEPRVVTPLPLISLPTLPPSHHPQDASEVMVSQSGSTAVIGKEADMTASPPDDSVHLRTPKCVVPRVDRSVSGGSFGQEWGPVAKGLSGRCLRRHNRRRRSPSPTTLTVGDLNPSTAHNSCSGGETAHRSSPLVSRPVDRITKLAKKSMRSLRSKGSMLSIRARVSHLSLRNPSQDPAATMHDSTERGRLGGKGSSASHAHGPTTAPTAVVIEPTTARHDLSSLSAITSPSFLSSPRPEHVILSPEITPSYSSIHVPSRAAFLNAPLIDCPTRSPTAGHAALLQPHESVPGVLSLSSSSAPFPSQPLTPVHVGSVSPSNVTNTQKSSSFFQGHISSSSRSSAPTVSPDSPSFAYSLPYQATRLDISPSSSGYSSPIMSSRRFLQATGTHNAVVEPPPFAYHLHSDQLRQDIHTCEDRSSPCIHDRTRSHASCPPFDGPELCRGKLRACNAVSDAACRPTFPLPSMHFGELDLGLEPAYDQHPRKSLQSMFLGRDEAARCCVGAGYPVAGCVGGGGIVATTKPRAHDQKCDAVKAEPVLQPTTGVYSTPPRMQQRVERVSIPHSPSLETSPWKHDRNYPWLASTASSIATPKSMTRRSFVQSSSPLRSQLSPRRSMDSASIRRRTIGERPGGGWGYS
ncbi:hypothetical protein M011DRAFT_454584 [Sporormia fimetaria CBS 119925]|uniref:Uncharacterized protein n=1 Tax=Sporormia fimetaria CBS 119925 TaxID=1340428 RepID=A0A6A6VNB8_9PLEO|nr:hypothetical protein M011DRAFT_454584 [Sporormia fimetaria CBS 119925]